MPSGIPYGIFFQTIPVDFPLFIPDFLSPIAAVLDLFAQALSLPQGSFSRLFPEGPFRFLV